MGFLMVREEEQAMTTVKQATATTKYRGPELRSEYDKNSTTAKARATTTATARAGLWLKRGRAVWVAFRVSGSFASLRMTA